MCGTALFVSAAVTNGLRVFVNCSIQVLWILPVSPAIMRARTRFRHACCLPCGSGWAWPVHWCLVWLVPGFSEARGGGAGSGRHEIEARDIGKVRRVEMNGDAKSTSR